MDANERFEELASQFKKDTGLLAPGKDVPTAVGNDPTYGQGYRWREWLKWLEKREGNMKGKPPIIESNPFRPNSRLWNAHELGKHAQRGADAEWFRQSKCEHCDTPLLREGELYEKLEQVRQETVKEVLGAFMFMEIGYDSLSDDSLSVQARIDRKRLEELKSKYQIQVSEGGIVLCQQKQMKR